MHVGMKFVKSKMCLLCLPAAGYEGTPRADGSDGKVWTSGESLSAQMIIIFLI